MALQAVDLFIIADLMRNGIQPSHVLSFGHPDILATPDELASLFEGRLLPIDSERVRRERVGAFRDGAIGSAYGFFSELNSELTCFDKRDLFGIDENLDLNYPIDVRHHGSYSLIIDPGTIEHVMNVGEALSSIVRALRVGGHAYHISPMSMLNHGYWNFSPVTYHDFYMANGFEIVRLEGRRKKGTTFPIPATDRFKENTNLMIVCVARKMRAVEKITWPMQEKYS
jgi:hypothetical protein